jgi:hypothetical protein
MSLAAGPDEPSQFEASVVINGADLRRRDLRRALGKLHFHRRTERRRGLTTLNRSFETTESSLGVLHFTQGLLVPSQTVIQFSL